MRFYATQSYVEDGFLRRRRWRRNMTNLLQILQISMMKGLQFQELRIPIWRICRISVWIYKTFEYGRFTANSPSYHGKACTDQLQLHCTTYSIVPQVIGEIREK